MEDTFTGNVSIRKRSPDWPGPLYLAEFYRKIQISSPFPYIRFGVERIVIRSRTGRIVSSGIEIVGLNGIEEDPHTR